MTANELPSISKAALRDIAVVVIDPAEDEAALCAAEDLVLKFGAHATAVFSPPLSQAVFASNNYADVKYWVEAIGQMHDAARRDFARLTERLSKAHAQIAVREMDLGRLASYEAALFSARRADLTIVTRPDPRANAAARFDLIETLLFQSGRPLLVVPPAWRGSLALTNVVIAWNESREAVRAISDALMIIGAAEHATLLTVNIDTDLDTEMTAHLARHRAKVVAKNIDAKGMPVGECILQYAVESGADLIVAGGYGHSRFREMIFGGVTRHLLEKSPVPVLMAH